MQPQNITINQSCYEVLVNKKIKDILPEDTYGVFAFFSQLYWGGQLKIVGPKTT